MILLALDLSSKASGYAVFDNGTLMASGVVIQNEKDSLKRVEEMTKKIVSIAKQLNVDTVVAEEVLPESVHGNIKTMKVLTWLQGAVLISLKRELNLAVEFMYPSSWRAVCGIHTGRGIKREELKQKDIEFAEKTYNIICKSDDQADAICIGHAYIKNNGGSAW